jgi:hypothetical protein
LRTLLVSRLFTATTVTVTALGVAAGTQGPTAALAAPAPDGSATCVYQPTRLPGLPGGDGSGEITDTDGAERFIGWAYLNTPTDTYPHGTVWHRGQLVRDFGRLNGVAGVNRSGDTVGIGFDSTAGIFWASDGDPVRLAFPPTVRYLVDAHAISDRGLITGWGSNGEPNNRTLAWHASTAGTAVSDLGNLGGIRALYDINDSDDRVAGTVETGGIKQAVTGTVGQLTRLDGVDPNANSTATDIAGRFILGSGTVPGQGAGTVLWEDGVPRLLRDLPLGTDVNTSGLAVGYETVDGRERALAVNATTRIVLPPLPGHVDARAAAVTEDGRVAGWSRPAGPLGTPKVPVIWACG